MAVKISVHRDARHWIAILTLALGTGLLAALAYFCLVGNTGVGQAQPLQDVVTGRGAVYSLDFRSDGRELAVGSQDGASLFDLEVQPISCTFFRRCIAGSVFFAFGEKVLVAGGHDNQVHFWLAPFAENALPQLRNPPAPASADLFRTLRDQGESAIKLDVKAGSIWSVQANHGKDQLFVAYRSDLLCYDTTAYPPRLSWTKTADNQNMRCIAVSHNGETVATGGEGNVVRLWECSTGKLLQTFPRLNGPIYSLAFSPVNETLAVGGGCDPALQIWNLTADGGSSLRQSFVGHKPGYGVKCVEFAPDGTLVASGSSDATAIIWNLASGAVLARFENLDQVNAVAFSPDGLKLATGCYQGHLRLWAVPRNNQ